jgi:predicted KAP-like P-loop ATPase
MTDERSHATRLLDDVPASEDAFGGHKRIAHAILKLVRDEKGGRAIALVGSWGSGKSTVVKLLQLATKQPSDRKSDTEVFVFDAWVHEGDPLRRSFLESLISHLQQKGWVDKERWNKKLEQLANKRKETKTKSSPVLTAKAVPFLLLAY